MTQPVLFQRCAKGLSQFARSVTLGTAVLLLGAVVIWTANAVIDQSEQEARAELQMSAGFLAHLVNAPLSHFDRLASTFSSSDLRQDHLTLTGRLLRLQLAIPHASAIFALNSSGRVVAASDPLSVATMDVSKAAWFTRAISAPTTDLELARIDASWLGDGPTIIATKVVRNDMGEPRGIVGAVFPVSTMSGLLRPVWLPRFSNASIQDSGTGPLVASRAPVPDGSAILAPTLGGRLFVALARVTRPAGPLEAIAPISAAQTVVAVRLSPAIMWQSGWRRAHNRILGLLAALTALGVLSAIWAAQRYSAATSTPDEAKAYGFDWSFRLARDGQLLSVDGYAPAEVRAAIGRQFVDLLDCNVANRSSDVATALRSRVGCRDAVTKFHSVAEDESTHGITIRRTPSGQFDGLARNVSRESALMQRLRASEIDATRIRDELDRTSLQRDQTLTALGHDVRTPMSSIIGICSLLRDSPMEPDQRQWIERIDASCETLLAMLNGLLEIASTDSGQAELHLCETDPAELVREVVGLLTFLADDKGLAMSTTIENRLAGRWMVDPTRFRQVVYNLVENAVKFTGSGGVTVRAAAVPMSDGQNAIRVSVNDTGPGIAPEDRDRIFQRFERGSGEEREGRDGLGLGLANCRANAALMQGTVAVESTVGVGTEFVFEFPARQVDQTATARPFAGRTAIIVGLDVVMAEQLRSQLEDVGFYVEEAIDGYLALGVGERIAARRSVLDLAIVDGDMMGMAADVFCRRFRSASFGKSAVLVCVAAGPQADVAEDCDIAVPASAGARAIVVAATRAIGEQPAMSALRPDAPLRSCGRVLVAEDNAVNRSFLVTALRRRGFTAFVACDGEEAVRLARTGGFDAILMDIQMPGMDGLEAARRIRSIPGRTASIPIIAVTALSGSVLQKRCADAGFTAVFQKPFDCERLIHNLGERIATSARSMFVQPRQAETRSQRERWALEQAGSAEMVETAYLEAMADDIGLERTKACVEEFVREVTERSRCISEYLPGWQSEAIVRQCRELQDQAETFGAVSIEAAAAALLDAVTQNEPKQAAAVQEELHNMLRPLWLSFEAHLRALEARRGGQARRAA